MKIKNCKPSPWSAELRFGAMLLGFAVGSTGASLAASATNTGVQLTKLDDRVRVEINGALFTEYVFKNVSKPYCYPLLGPSGAGMTRDWPLKETPGEEHDHPHHTGLWFGHQKVNGNNFWTVAAGTGKIVQETLVAAESGPDVGVLTTRNQWVAKDGTVVLTDERTLRFYNRVQDRVMDFDVTLRAGDSDVTLGDDKDALMAIRVAESMRALKPLVKGEKAKAGDGRIALSSGVKDTGESAAAAKDAKREAVTWGKRAEWCDYSGPVNGKIVGVALFDHPANPRHPTWWHVRDYGLFAANPFGQHYFENLPDANAGNLTIPRGQSVTFRYRFYFHDGDEQKGQVAERYKEYVQSTGKSAK